MDLNWCPCGRHCPEGCMYCSDNCYMKELAASDGRSSNKRIGKKFKKDKFYSYPYGKKSYDLKSIYGEHLLKSSNNLVFKNRREYYCPSMCNNNQHHRSKDMASSCDSYTSTIDDYFRKQTSSNTKSQNIPKQKLNIVKPKETESTKEKTEIKSYDSRSSYVIEAVYPVQNYTSTITVY